MFDSILIRPNSSRSHPLDCGQMIENLFFYKKSIVHIGRNQIRSLFDLAEVDTLEQLLSLPYLSFYYNNSHTAVGNNNNVLFVDSIGLADLDIEKELYEESFRYKGDAFKSKKFAKKISRLVKPYELPKNFYKVLNEELKDKKFRNKVLIETIKKYYPNHPFKLDEIRYDLEYLDDTQFKVHSNFDSLVNNKIAIDSPILALINACEDLHVMSEYSSEISLPEFNSKLIRLKLNSALEKSNKSKKEIEVFNHFVFDESWALREAINSKQIHVKAVLKLLQKGEKYKEWLSDLSNDGNLMLEYVKKIEEKSILESLPLKAIRFYFFNGVGFILGAINPDVGIPATIAVNAFDTFLLENLTKKWKPSQFVEAELRPLVKNKELNNDFG